MGKTYYKLTVDKETYDLVIKCKDLIYEIDPKLEAIPLSQNYVIRRISRFFLAGTPFELNQNE